MKTLSVLLLLAPLGLAACAPSPPMDPRIDATARQQQEIDEWFVDTPNHADVTSGVLAQRTLFPYDFDPGAARLTELGRRDLAILAQYYRTTPGPLTLVRGDASADLYAARTAVVRGALQQAGVDLAKVTIADGSPDGRGISGQYIVNTAKNDKGSFSGSGADTGGLLNQGLAPSSSDSSMKGSNP